MTTYSILATAGAGAVAYALGGHRSWESPAFGTWRGAVLSFAGVGRTRTHVATMPNPQTKRSARHLGTITT